MTKAVIRSSVMGLAAMALAGTLSVNSASADVTYTGESVPFGDNISITGPTNVSGIAGQIKLTGTNTPGSTLLAWCLDIYDYLKSAGAYSVTPNGPINGAPNTHIGGLMVYGNNLIQTNTHLTVDGISFDLQDESAATQVAIWSAEYGSLTYNITTSTHGATTQDFKDLVTAINNAAGTSNYSTLDPDCAANPAGCPNQRLGFVPGPIAGTGLPGLLAACAGLIALARRRRQRQRIA